MFGFIKQGGVPCVFGFMKQGGGGSLLCPVFGFIWQGGQLSRVPCVWFYIEAGTTFEGEGGVRYPLPPVVGRVEVE